MCVGESESTKITSKKKQKKKLTEHKANLREYNGKREKFFNNLNDVNNFGPRARYLLYDDENLKELSKFR